jgi:hypothetical protein
MEALSAHINHEQERRMSGTLQRGDLTLSQLQTMLQGWRLLDAFNRYPGNPVDLPRARSNANQEIEIRVPISLRQHGDASIAGHEDVCQTLGTLHNPTAISHNYT